MMTPLRIPRARVDLNCPRCQKIPSLKEMTFISFNATIPSMQVFAYECHDCNLVGMVCPSVEQAERSWRLGVE